MRNEKRFDARTVSCITKGRYRAPSSSLLNKENEAICCWMFAASIYLEMKYDSGTWWPSFTSIEGNLETKRDFKLIFPVQNITVLVAKVIRVIYLKILSQQVNDGANNGGCSGVYPSLRRSERAPPQNSQQGIINDQPDGWSRMFQLSWENRDGRGFWPLKLSKPPRNKLENRSH